jgi:hypothetical protein
MDPRLDPELLRSTLEGVADLDPDEDGRCQSYSIAYGVEQVPLIVFGSASTSPSTVDGHSGDPGLSHRHRVAWGTA